jgi:hypothetical protein
MRHEEHPPGTYAPPDVEAGFRKRHAALDLQMAARIPRNALGASNALAAETGGRVYRVPSGPARTTRETFVRSHQPGGPPSRGSRAQ